MKKICNRRVVMLILVVVVMIGSFLWPGIIREILHFNTVKEAIQSGSPNVQIIAEFTYQNWIYVYCTDEASREFSWYVVEKDQQGYKKEYQAGTIDAKTNENYPIPVMVYAKSAMSRNEELAIVEPLFQNPDEYNCADAIESRFQKILLPNNKCMYYTFANVDQEGYYVEVNGWKYEFNTASWWRNPIMD